MSIYRRAANVDKGQYEVMKALRAAGVEVWAIRQPCDLLTRFWCNRHQEHCWMPLEVKTLYGVKNPKPRTDYRQVRQHEFLLRTHTPVVTDFDSAWRELNKRHALASISVPCVLKSIAV